MNEGSAFLGFIAGVVTAYVTVAIALAVFFAGKSEESK